MKKLLFIFICFLMLITATSCTTKFDKTNTANIYVQIVLSNNKKINLRLYRSKAPLTVDNFIELAEDGYYKNTIFHRVVEDFVIQGGGYEMSAGSLVPKDKVDSIKGEFSSNGWSRNDIKHELGVISMARTTVNDSATSQFFLCSATCPTLDGDYAAFGKTTDQQSNQLILAISQMDTYVYSNDFTNMPFEVIKIKKVKLSNTKFEA